MFSVISTICCIRSNYKSKVTGAKFEVEAERAIGEENVT
jgi:hypothetical protein